MVPAHYSRDELAIWADRIKASGAKRVWVYFNNDNDAHAPKNATALRRMLGPPSGPKEGGWNFASISTAYELCKRRKSVIVVDRGRICGGMTSRTSAHLAPLCDDLVSEMTKLKGHDATKLFCDSQAAAVDRIEEIQKSEKIDCDF